MEGLGRANKQMYKIKLGINSRAILKPKPNKIYPGVEDKYRQKGTWKASVAIDKKLAKSLKQRGLPPIRSQSLQRSRMPRRSQIKELSLNNFESLTGFESVFRLLQKQKELSELEVGLTRKEKRRRTKKSWRE